eukprot:TRINITY_DN886_c0_g2_i1.p1 TRINITY_DN886_c0_g2~~TRINITY_DN886_c0_g2_i1.p1  ORF type:complete len:148 (-),score=22.69 TRINITY_DN886_c0_g2_i1:69-512(-)
MAIHYLFVFNRQGKIRLAKYYSAYDDEEKKKLAVEVHRVVTSRSIRFTNFVEFKNHKLVYRRYAGLFFVMAIDATDNELGYLEAIHLYVEVLDAYFGSVCELDLVFNFFKAYTALDEMFLGGQIMETSKRVVLARLERIDFGMKDGK